MFYLSPAVLNFPVLSGDKTFLCYKLVLCLCLQAALSVVPVPGLSSSVPVDLQPLLFHESYLEFLVGAEPVLCTLILLYLLECYWSL